VIAVQMCQQQRGQCVRAGAGGRQQQLHAASAVDQKRLAARTSVDGPARLPSGMGRPVPSSVPSIMGRVYLPGAVIVGYSRPADTHVRSW